MELQLSLDVTPVDMTDSDFLHIIWFTPLCVYVWEKEWKILWKVHLMPPCGVCFMHFCVCLSIYVKSFELTFNVGEKHFTKNYYY